MSTTVIGVRGKDRVALLADSTFVYVGRRCWGWKDSPFANPYTVKVWGEAAVELFAEDLNDALAGREARSRPMPGAAACTSWHGPRFETIAQRLPELRGKVLGCWCGRWEPGQPEIGCHAVVLAKAADALREART